MAAKETRGIRDRDPAEIGLHSIKPKPGSRRPRKRIGRGEGSGTGKQAGRGHKGAGSRSGSKSKPGYEGGQNPIHMRMRKLRGPHRKMSMPFEKFRTRTQPVNVGDLDERFKADAEVTPETLRDAGLAKRRHPVKILGNGEIKTKLTVKAHAFSASAKEKIEGAGGSCEVIEVTKKKVEEPAGDQDHRQRLHGPGDPAQDPLRRRRSSLSTGSAPTSPRPASTSSTVNDIESNFAGSNILGFLNLFSGGSLSRLCLFSLGIMPYITASIILQLLTVVVPSLEKLQKEGEVGQQKITQYTRYLTVALAFGQSIGYVFLFRSFQNQQGTSVVGELTFAKTMLIVICLTAGCTLLMWMGELITQRGVGNGISLLIFASITARVAEGIQKWWTNPDQVFVVMMPFIALAVIVAIVFVQEGQRRIPVQYAKRVVGRRMTAGGSTYLPLRVNMAGVIPVIFAASIMAFPPTIGQLINTPAALDFAAFFSPNSWAYVIGEVFFIIIFTYFYTAVTFNPVDQADNLKQHGGFIPGVRPGRPTAEYLDRILSRLTFPGALYPRRRRRAADDPDQPDLGQLLLRRHLDPDRRRRRPRHGEAARGAADDAQLRGVPQITVAQPRPARSARAAARARRASASRKTSGCPTRPPATSSAPR